MRLLGLILVLGVWVAVGCSGSDSTTSAGSEVMKASDKGGAKPSPDLPPPMAAGGGGQKSGKFKLGKS